MRIVRLINVVMVGFMSVVAVSGDLVVDPSQCDRRGGWIVGDPTTSRTAVETYDCGGRTAFAVTRHHPDKPTAGVGKLRLTYLEFADGEAVVPCSGAGASLSEYIVRVKGWGKPGSVITGGWRVDTRTLTISEVGRDKVSDCRPLVAMD